MDQSYIPPLANFYPTGHAPMMPPHPEVYDPALQHFQPLPAEDYAGFNEGEASSFQISTPQQGEPSPSQRRRPQATDRAKHKRTRSGCFTCRQRRVKCDEARPVCERCRKGDRECRYPPAASSSRGARKAKNRQSMDSRDSVASSDDEGSGEGASGLLDPIPDDQELFEDGDNPVCLTRRSTSATSDNVSPGPQLSSQRAASFANSIPASTSGQLGQDKWSSLSRDVKTYLRYFKEHMSYHHYAFKFDRGQFVKTTLLEYALNDDSGALLHAIVAFAAYHHAVSHDSMRLSPFLSYYNKAIVLLHRSFGNKKPDVTTLFTILQLASIEEFLGDWVNLLGHQRAAYQILTDLFTPDTIMRDSTCRQLINWFLRFDLFAGIMSGGETTLSREWFAVCERFYREQAEQNPDDLGARFDDYFATCRLMATDVTLLNAQRGRNTISEADFLTQIEERKEQFATFGHSLETAFKDSSNFIKDFSDAPPPSESDIVDFRDPNFVYGGELSVMNNVLMDFWALDLMFKHQINLALRQPAPAELTQLALKKCKMFEAVQYSKESTPGSILGLQAGLGIAALFLPKDEKHILWCRRKYAFVESLGYIYPATLRTHMTELWGVDVTHWWLPNEEGYPPTVKAIRDFIDYRARIPEDAMGAHVRDMTGIFRSLDMQEGNETPLTATTTSSSGGFWEREGS